MNANYLKFFIQMISNAELIETNNNCKKKILPAKTKNLDKTDLIFEKIDFAERSDLDFCHNKKEKYHNLKKLNLKRIAQKK